MKKIALEEHYGSPGFMKLRSDWLARMNMPMNLPEEALKQMIFLSGDIDQRLEEMDKLDIAYQILLPGTTSVDGVLDHDEALDVSKRHNEAVAKIVDDHPDRFLAYASIPLQAPELAAKELERCFKEYKGFKGAWLSGYVHNTGFVDEEKFSPIFETGEKLGAHFYIHPTETDPMFARIFDGCPALLGPPWGWGIETGTFVLRIIMNGVLDRYPGTSIIMAHMGEMIPFALWRLENRLVRENKTGNLKKRVPEYFRDNISITISGCLSNEALRCAIEMLGAGRIMFAMDYPYEPMAPACEFIENAAVDEHERELICYKNAAKMFGIEM